MRSEEVTSIVKKCNELLYEIHASIGKLNLPSKREDAEYEIIEYGS